MPKYMVMKQVKISHFVSSQRKTTQHLWEVVILI
jgi:hypothetical protein